MYVLLSFVNEKVGQHFNLHCLIALSSHFGEQYSVAYYSTLMNCFFGAFLAPNQTICMLEGLSLVTSDHEVLGLNLSRGRIYFMTLWHFMAYSLSLSPIHHLNPCHAE